MPTLVVAKIVCYFRKTGLIIDWHNFGHSILALKLGSNHPMIKMLRFYEVISCHFATAHFCVSTAMARTLSHIWHIQKPIFVIHDRPPSLFKPIESQKEKYRFLSSLPETSEHAKSIASGNSRLIVTSTSWTPDEDFSLLIDVLCRYSSMALSTHSDLPSLCVVITGKGPQKEQYLSLITTLMHKGKLKKVTLKTAWLQLEDYAKLLACSSLGISLHTSSSGLDLPMKVVDMFGAGLPVVGWNKYESWTELVTEGVNGLGFANADQFLSHLLALLAKDSDQLDILRGGALEESEYRWDDEWDSVASKAFEIL